MAQWSAEVEIDAGLVRRLLSSQFPELELGSLHLLAEGWDNAVWVVDARWAFRFPRRAIAIPGFERELSALPRLAPLLPLAIPTPAFRGEPADGYPWPFSGAPLLPGHELPDVALTDAARARIAWPLAGFLRTLHAPATAAAIAGVCALPADPLGRADMRRRVPRTAALLDELRRLDLWRAPASVRRLLDAARLLPRPRASVLAHGDLHVRHLLVDRAGAATAVIDWGDLCRADPSVDLSLYWSLLPPPGRLAFLAAYGEPTEDQLLRARVLAFFLCGTLAVYARREGMTALRREAVAGLRRSAAD